MNLLKQKVKISGFVENMGGFVCTHCGETSHLFGDGARDWARDKSVTFLGSVPLEKEVMVSNGDLINDVMQICRFSNPVHFFLLLHFRHARVTNLISSCYSASW